MPGRVAFSAAAEATMTESPIAVTCRPDTFGSFAAAAWHAAAGAGDPDAGDTDGLAETAPGLVPRALGWTLAWAEACAEAWDAALIRWPSATCCSSPGGAAELGGRATP